MSGCIILKGIDPMKDEWYKWKKTDFKWYYEFYLFTSTGLQEEPCCIRNNFNCNGCDEYEGE